MKDQETPLFKKLRAAIKPLLDDAQDKCPGVFTDFQLNESYTVELSLTIQELRAMALIFEPLLYAKLEVKEQHFIDGKKDLDAIEEEFQ